MMGGVIDIDSKREKRLNNPDNYMYCRTDEGLQVVALAVFDEIVDGTMTWDQVSGGDQIMRSIVEKYIEAVRKVRGNK